MIRTITRASKWSLLQDDHHLLIIIMIIIIRGPNDQNFFIMIIKMIIRGSRKNYQHLSMRRIWNTTCWSTSASSSSGGIKIYKTQNNQSNQISFLLAVKLLIMIHNNAVWKQTEDGKSGSYGYGKKRPLQQLHYTSVFSITNKQKTIQCNKTCRANAISIVYIYI